MRECWELEWRVQTPDGKSPRVEKDIRARDACKHGEREWLSSEN